MSDILIREVAEATVEEIDRRAHDMGISRNEFLRRWLEQSIHSPEVVTVDDLRRMSLLVGDLADPDVMRQAWS